MEHIEANLRGAIAAMNDSISDANSKGGGARMMVMATTVVRVAVAPEAPPEMGTVLESAADEVNRAVVEAVASGFSVTMRAAMDGTLLEADISGAEAETPEVRVAQPEPPAEMVDAELESMHKESASEEVVEITSEEN